MSYEDFKLLIERKVLTKEEYLKLRKKLGNNLARELFEEYIKEEDALNNEKKFKYIACYYYEEIENETETENDELKFNEEGQDEDYNEKNYSDTYLSDNSITQYLKSLSNKPLLDQKEEKELSKKINDLYDTLKNRIILSSKELKDIINSTKEEQQRDIEEILIDNYFNNALNELNYPKRLKIKSIDKKHADDYSKYTSKEERIKQFHFLKKELNKRVELLKEQKKLLVDDSTKTEYIEKVELLYKDINKIKELSELLGIQIEYLTSFDKFFEANTKLAFSIAMRHKTNNFTQIDVVQAANIGLIKAIKRFNPEMGYKFSTYATWWIRQSSLRHICDNESIIRKPVHARELLNKILSTKKKLELTMDKEPTNEEIANELNLPIEKVNELLFINYTSDPISLQTKIGEDEDTDLSDFIVDQGITLQEEVNYKLLKQELKKMLNTLTPRECEVLVRRFGLDGGKEETLEEVGIYFGITRERIRQIESKALRKLRHPTRSKHLKDFL